jgi:Zn-dependent peptidase ImmA (M78 family)
VPAADVAYINSKILTWAVSRSRLSRAEIAARVKVSEEQVRAWEKTEHPPFRKARELAKILQFPFGYFFLPTPPEDELPIPDFRRLGRDYRPTPELQQLLSDVLVRQDWFRDYLRESGRPTKLRFIGAFTVEDKVNDVATDIRKTLKITPEFRNTISSWTEYLSALVRNAEEAGILVMRSSVVGNSTNRPLSTKEVQGFAIADQAVPLVFVNSGDFKAAQIFTFAHELAHLWIGQSAIANPDETKPDTNRIEAFCNRVAASVLLPANEFQSAWDSTHPDSRTAVLPRRFWVSSLVILRRAHEFDRLSTADFHELVERERAKLQKAKKPGGGDFYRTLVVRMGSRFTSSVVGEVNQNRLLIRDAARLLSISPRSLAKFADMAK